MRNSNYDTTHPQSPSKQTAENGKGDSKAPFTPKGPYPKAIRRFSKDDSDIDRPRKSGLDRDLAYYNQRPRGGQRQGMRGYLQEIGTRNGKPNQSRFGAGGSPQRERFERDNGVRGPNKYQPSRRVYQVKDQTLLKNQDSGQYRGRGRSMMTRGTGYGGRRTNQTD